MGWGGRRRGAGRKPAGERAGVPHLKRPRLAARFPVLVTMRLRGGLESLRTNEAHAREVRNALLYVLQNARKHGSWRARGPDPYSSGPSFDGWKEGVGKVADSSARLLARARTWLLSLGWRRHGLIDPREVPRGSPAPG